MKAVNVVITGAGRGIGLAAVKSLLEDYEYTRVYAVSRHTGNLDQLHQAYPSRLVLKQADLAVELNSGMKLATEVETAMGQIHVLINNAGQLLNMPVGESRLEEVKQILDINLLVPGFLSSHLLRLFDPSSRGHIVNIGSMGGFQGSVKFPGLAYYSASKGALAVLTECMATEWKDRNISVNCLAPGSVNTEMLQQAFPGYNAPVNAEAMGKFVAQFALTGATLMSGKIIPLSLSIP